MMVVPICVLMESVVLFMIITWRNTVNKTIFLSLLMCTNFFVMNSSEQSSCNTQQHAYVAIRSLVALLEFKVVLKSKLRHHLNDEILSLYKSGIEALDVLKETVPLLCKEKELLEKFGNQQLIEESKHIYAKRTFSSEMQKYIRRISQSVSIFVESLYKEGKMTQEHKDTICRCAQDLIQAPWI